MSEYIKRSSIMGKLTSSDTQKAIREMDGEQTYSYFLGLVNEEQATDVVEAKHGEWLLRHEGRGHYWECSVCHKNPCIYVTKDTSFCPNCGARMDGE